MKKVFYYIVALSLVCLLVCFMFAQYQPSTRLAPKDEIELVRMIAGLNADLPRDVGTIGRLDSLSLEDKAITYSMSVNGDEQIMQFYADNHDEFKDILKYAFIEMNGQRNMGSTFLHALKTKDLSIRVKIYTTKSKFEQWDITGEELSAFIDSCKLTPTKALQTVIDMQVKFANMKLPVSDKDTRLVTNVVTNSIGSDSQDCSLYAIKHEGEDIFFEYKINKKNMKDLESVKDRFEDLNFLDAYAQELAQDKDMREFMGSFAIAHSNMVLVYREDKSNKKVSIKLPYTVLRDHCVVPQELLSVN